MEDIEIKVDINEKKYLVSKYNEETMSLELRDYIFNEILGKSIDKKVIIKFNTKFKVSSKDEVRYISIIRKEYRECLNELVYESGSSDIRKFFLFIMGTFFIICSYIFTDFIGEVFNQVLTVFGWVALWEVASSILFTDSKRRRKMKRYKQLLNGEIYFNK